MVGVDTVGEKGTWGILVKLEGSYSIGGGLKLR